MPTVGLFERLLAPADTLPATDRFWYGELGETLDNPAGIKVTPENALQIAAFHAAVKVRSEDIASLPLPLFRRQPDGRGKDRVTDHAAAERMSFGPNEWMTPFEYREQVEVHWAIRGNAYGRILNTPAGEFDGVIPLNPARMTVEQLPSRRLRYTYRDRDGHEHVFVQDEIDHHRNMTLDGIVGLSLVGLARRSLGLTVAAEEYGARSFKNDPHLSVVLKHDKVLSDDANKRIASSFRDARTGPDAAWTPAVIEEGMDLTTVGVTSKDAQFLETRDHQLLDTGRWVRMAPPKLGDYSRATYGNVEQAQISHVGDVVRPGAERREQSLNRAWLTQRERREGLFFEHLLEGALRGDIETRYKAYQIAVLTGWMSRNEVRNLENLNAEPGLDELLVPMNMANATDAGGGQALAFLPGGPQLVDQRAMSSARMIVEEVSAGVVRKEVAAVTRIARKHADSEAAFREELESFYDDHYEHVSNALQLPPRAARSYVDAQREAVVDGGVAVTERWNEERPAELVTLAIGTVTA